ncbi:MAG: Gfo/Idh/MocA family oxidoreductase [Thermomicrobiales bacterium]
MGATRRIKTGLIGCGSIGPAHAQALAKLPQSDFIACADSDQSRATALAAEYGVASYSSLDELLDAGIEALMVCTPHKSHEAIVTRAAAAGVHVLCEKPISVELDAADRMIAATDAAGVTFGVVFMRRFWPAAQRIHRAIEAGEIGYPSLGMCQTLLWRPELYFALGAWRGTWVGEGGGVLINQAVHVIDMLQWFMGPITEVYGKYATLVHGDYIDVEDTVAATLTCASGGLAIIQAATTVNPQLGFRVSVHGSNGSSLSVWEHPEGTQGYNDIWSLDPTDELRQSWETAELNQPGFPGFHTLQIEDFLQAILEGRDPAVTGREARKSLAIIQAIYTSSRTGQPVRLD